MVRKLLSLFIFAFVISCVPQVKQTECEENEAYDPGERKCVPKINGATTNTVFVQSKVPEDSYIQTIGQSSVVHSVAISDIYNFGFYVLWTLNHNDGSTINQFTSSGTSFTFNNTLYGIGNYVLEARVYDNASLTNLLDQTSWSLSVLAVQTPEFSSPSPDTLLSATITDTATSIDVDITDTAGYCTGSAPCRLEWYINGTEIIAEKSNITSTGVTDTLNMDLTATPFFQIAGSYSVQALLKDTTATQVLSSETWTVTIGIPTLPILSVTPGASNATLADALQAVQNIDIDISTPAPSGQGLLSSAGLPVDVCVNVDDPNGTDNVSGVRYNFYVNTELSPAVASTVTTAAGAVCLSALNSAYNFSTLTNSSIIVQAIDVNTNIKVANSGLIWPVAVIEQNSEPELTLVQADHAAICSTQTSSTILSGCLVAQDTTNTFQFELSDDHYDATVNEDEFSVVFYLSSSPLDTTNTFSTSDCQHIDAIDTAPAKYQCSLNFASAGTSGPLAPGAYTLTAQVTDTGSPYTTSDAVSNIVQWNIAVTESQTAPTIDSLNDAIAVHTAGESYIADYDTDSSCDPIGAYTIIDGILGANPVTESDYIYINAAITDAESDNFKIDYEYQNSGGAWNTLAASQTITRTDNNTPYDIGRCVQLPEDAVINTASSNVSIRVRVTDIPDGSGLGIPSEEIFVITVNQFNPLPTFDGISAASPVLTNGGTDRNIVAGFPHTFKAQSATDASTDDGTMISYQWQVRYGLAGAYTNIPDSNSSTFVWTPPLFVTNGTDLEVRVCLFDEGYYDNLGVDLDIQTNPADCDLTTAGVNHEVWSEYKIYTSRHVVAESSGPLPSSGNEVVTWYDQANTNLYTIYVNGVSPADQNIVIERSSLNIATGEFSVNSSLVITEIIAANVAQYENVTELSVTGVSGGFLYISYMLNDISVVSTSTPTIQVLKVKIDNATQMQHAHTMAYTNSLGNASVTSPADDYLETIQVISGIADVTGSLSITHNGIVYSYNYGTDFCNPDCGANGDTSMTEIETAINGQSNLHNVVASYDSVTDILTISKPSNDTHEFNTRVPIKLGRILYDSTNNQVLLPFVDSTRLLDISVVQFGNPNINTNDLQTAVSASSGYYDLTTSTTFNKELDSLLSSTNQLVIATKDQNSNIDIYEFDPTALGVGTATDSNSDIFSLSANSLSGVDSFKITEDSNGAIFVAAITEDASTTDTHLSVAVVDSTNMAANVVIEEKFSDLTYSIMNLSKIDIAAHGDGSSTAILAYTTNGSHTDSDLNAHLAKLTVDSTTWTALDLAEYNSPRLNTTDGNVIAGSVISLTSVSTQQVSGDDGDTVGDATNYVMALSFHEGTSIYSGLYNVESDIITPQSTDNSFYMNSLIGN